MNRWNLPSHRQAKSPVPEVLRQEKKDKFLQHIHTENAQWLAAWPLGEPSLPFHDWLQMEVPWESILETVAERSLPHPKSEPRVERLIRSQIKLLELAVKMFTSGTDPVWNDHFRVSSLQTSEIVLELCNDFSQGRVSGPDELLYRPTTLPVVDPTPDSQCVPPVVKSDRRSNPEDAVQVVFNGRS